MSGRIEISPLRRYDFGGLSAGASLGVEVARGVDLGADRAGVLEVRVKRRSVGAGSDGMIRVGVRVDGHGADDPAALFTGRKLAQVIAATETTGAPRYEHAAFFPGTDRVVVTVEGVQGSGAAAALDADLSISIVPRPADVLLPGQVPGRILHLDALQGVEATGAMLVDRWRDLSGAGHDFTGSGTQRPTWVPADDRLHGNASVAFGGASAFRRLVCSTLPTSGTARTGVVVARLEQDPPASVDDAGLWLFGTGVKSAVPDTDGVIKDKFGVSARVTAADPARSLASPFVYMVTAQTDHWACWVDGGAPLHEVTSGVTFAAPATVQIGAANSSTSSWRGPIGELVVYDRALRRDELDGVGRYLAAKYRIPWSPLT